MAKTNKRLQTAPHSPHLHALRMVGCDHYGDYLCVLESSGPATATSTLEYIREEALANALHHTGQPLVAAELRRAAIWDAARPVRTEWNYGSLFLDLEAAGDIEAACDVAWEAVAWDPDTATPWALAARCAAATGSLEEAESYLWLAAETGRTSILLGISRIDIHRTLGDPHHSAILAQTNTRTQQRSMRYTIARHRANLAVANPDPVIDSYDRKVWLLDDEVWHPELLAAYGEAFALAGHTDMAGELVDRLASLYPDSAAAQAAATALRLKIQRQTPPH